MRNLLVRLSLVLLVLAIGASAAKTQYNGKGPVRFYLGRRSADLAGRVDGRFRKGDGKRKKGRLRHVGLGCFDIRQ